MNSTASVVEDKEVQLQENNNSDVVEVELEPVDLQLKETHDSVTEKIIKIEEEIKKPEPIILKRVDDGYRRSNGELSYKDLSKKSKAIQDELYSIMRDESFEFSKAGIDYLSKNDELLNKIYKIMENNDNLSFEIAGHVSIRPGDDKYNRYISVMRAANIKKKLISMGIKNTRMKGRGYGDKIPLIQDEIKIFNRIEFNIIGE
ncbi:OmpA family protein [Malaciobacter marinus]|uniref:OmpA family protein n=1 Tax=Malaciobacter marinus TaxID=505249 RepID=UPI003B00C95B